MLFAQFELPQLNGRSRFRFNDKRVNSFDTKNAKEKRPHSFDRKNMKEKRRNLSDTKTPNGNEDSNSFCTELVQSSFCNVACPRQTHRVGNRLDSVNGKAANGNKDCNSFCTERVKSVPSAP